MRRKGGMTGPAPVTGRRWRLALIGVAGGAAVGATAAVLVSRWRGQDAPGAQEPEQLRAVVDTSRDGTPI